MLRPSKIWKFDTAYTDLSSYTKTDAAFTFIATKDDIFYIGSDRRFIGLDITLSTNGSYTGLVASVWDGTAWTQVEEVNDYNFDTTSHYIWNLPADWNMYRFTSLLPHAKVPPSSVEMYWLRLAVTGVTTAAVISRIRCLPYCMYCTTKDVATKLGLNSADVFTHTSVPVTSDAVEDMISDVQADIDWTLQQSWRLNYKEEETHDFNISGIKLIQRDIIRINLVQLWNGSTWETQTEGRTHDYFYVPEHGMLYWSRYFMLPARMALTGTLWGGWGVGEFIFPVKVTYTWGRNWEKDKKFPQIKELAAKMSALRVLDTTNYLALIPSGTRGGEDMQARVERWKRDVDEIIDHLKPMMWF